MTALTLTPVDLAAPDHAGTRRAESSAKPLLVLGPSLGTSVTALWSGAARLLAEDFDVLGWELPGHGRGTPHHQPVTIAELAQAVADLVRTAQQERGDAGEPVLYAGDSVGGAVGLELALSRPELLRGLALFCTGARIGEPSAWAERAELVQAAGTPTQVIGSTQRWFAPGFLERDRETATELLHSLQDADRHDYAAVCRALGAFDMRERLGEVGVPVLTVAGRHDAVTGPEVLAEIAQGVPDARSLVLEDAAHLVPAEQPQATAQALRGFVDRLDGAPQDRAASAPAAPAGEQTRDQTSAAGMDVRRAVLSDAHVDRAQARTTGFTADFQDFITRYAWGEIWTRPGLDRPTRSAVVLTAMMAHGHWDEFRMHVRAARRNGVSVDQIREILLQNAVYLGVPTANTAFAQAQQVLQELGDL